MRKDDVIQFRVSTDEKGELKRRAELQHISVSDLIRQKLKLDSSGPTYAGQPPNKSPYDDPEKHEEVVADWKKAVPLK